MSARQALDVCRWLQEQRRKHGLRPSALQVVHAIAHRIDGEFRAWPSLATLCRDTGLALATIKRALNALEAAGVITRERRRRADGSHGSTVYRITGEGIPGQASLPLESPVDNPKGGLAHGEPRTGSRRAMPSERDHSNGDIYLEESLGPAPVVDPETVAKLPSVLRSIVERRVGIHAPPSGVE